MSDPVHIGQLLSDFLAPEGVIPPEPKNVKCLLCYSVFTSKAHWFGKHFHYANICQACADDWDRHGRDEIPYPGEKRLLCSKCHHPQNVHGARRERYWYYEVNCQFCKTLSVALWHRFAKKKVTKVKHNPGGDEY
jgi:hypothetical protein